MTTQDYMKGTYKKFRPLIKILSHYDCPTDCMGSCCKVDEITFSRSERTRLLKRAPHARDAILQATVQKATLSNGAPTEQYRFAEHPCPLLSDKRCSVHGYAPLVCQSYPFSPGKGAPAGYITIVPCPLGIAVMQDFVLWLAANYLQYGAEGISRIKEEIARLKVITDDAATRPQTARYGETVSLMHVPFQYMQTFCDWLDKYTPDDRLRDKKEFGIV